MNDDDDEKRDGIKISDRQWSKMKTREEIIMWNDDHGLRREKRLEKNRLRKEFLSSMAISFFSFFCFFDFFFFALFSLLLFFFDFFLNFKNS